MVVYIVEQSVQEYDSDMCPKVYETLKTMILLRTLKIYKIIFAFWEQG